MLEQTAMLFMEAPKKGKSNTDLYQRAIEKWGAASQVTQGAEECTELALALLHLNRSNKPKALSHVVEEIADVELMIEQLKYMLDIPLSAVHNWKVKKLRRLARLLKEEAHIEKHHHQEALVGLPRQEEGVCRNMGLPLEPLEPAGSDCGGREGQDPRQGGHQLSALQV